MYSRRSGKGVGCSISCTETPSPFEDMGRSSSILNRVSTSLSYSPLYSGTLPPSSHGCLHTFLHLPSLLQFCFPQLRIRTNRPHNFHVLWTASRVPSSTKCRRRLSRHPVRQPSNRPSTPFAAAAVQTGNHARTAYGVDPNQRLIDAGYTCATQL